MKLIPRPMLTDKLERFWKMMKEEEIEEEKIDIEASFIPTVSSSEEVLLAR